jgi:hypothetical protein
MPIPKNRSSIKIRNHFLGNRKLKKRYAEK